MNILKDFFVRWTYMWLNLFVSFVAIITLAFYVPTGLILWYTKKIMDKNDLKSESNKLIDELYNE